MNNEKELFDYNLQPSDFELVQTTQKISDTKIEAKPTTFLKDSLKRFCKNKSSIVGAVILGILILLSIFVPIFSDANITRVSSTESHLAPKLFESGTGFWDGTVKYKDIVYDSINEVPADFYKPAVVEGTLVVDDEPSYIDQANAFGVGGYVMFAHEKFGEYTDENKVLYTSVANYTASGDYKVDITLFDKNNVHYSELGEYCIYLEYDIGVDEETKEVITEKIILKDWSKDYTSYQLDISNALVEANKTTVENARFTIELKPVEENYSYILIESIVFSNSENNEKVKGFSFEDATKMVLEPMTLEGTEDKYGNKESNPAYWSCTGRKGIHNSQVYFCSFTFDTYAAAYDAQIKTVAASDFKEWEEQGLCKLTFESQRDKTSKLPLYNLVEDSVVFERLSEDCPFESVAKVTINPKTGKLTSVDVYINRYELLGYEKMPKFLFGTDDSGHDLFKKCFFGLRTSLILGVCTAIFCFLFGLCWGAISGYFGGNVDLFMERFCDILSGVPWIVVMTLCILHMGSSLLTFFLALCMTGWMGTAARTRTQFYRFKGREYVLASRTLGSSDIRLIFKHILPNSLGTIITSSVFMITSVIFSEAQLSYLNLGLQGENSFGVLLSENQKFITKSPYLIVVPAIIISLMMISFNLFGNGLRDAVNPSLKGSE